MRLILASASPRRQELIGLLGLPFEVMPSRYDEPAAAGEVVSMSGFVTHLALNKAREVARRVGDGLVLGADTEVSLSAGDMGSPLGKPANHEDAVRMVGLLVGATHSVFTGVALVDAATGEEEIACVQTRVTFRPMSPEQIEAYVATGEPMDKAGGYGAQGAASPYIAGYEGDFYNVVGLPLCTVAQMLEARGVEWWGGSR